MAKREKSSIKSEYNIGEKIDNWEIIEKTTNPRSRKEYTRYKYKIRCLTCGETVRLVGYYDLLSLGKECAKCCHHKVNLSHRSVFPGMRFGRLLVIGDGGYRDRYGKPRHYSLVQCDCGESEPFVVLDNLLKNGHKKSCGCISSVGELSIQKYLDDNNIEYIKEFSFPGLCNDKTKKLLRFDFAIFDNNHRLLALIEFDGRQHIDGPDTSYWGHSPDTLQSIQYRDRLKNDYCKSHNIPLCRIPYYKKEKVPEILADFLETIQIK